MGTESQLQPPPAPRVPSAFSARRYLTEPPGGAVLMLTASRTAVRPKLMAVTWVPLPTGSRWTKTTRPRAFTAGTSTCSPSLIRYSARTRSICFSCQANDPGLLSCSGRGP